MSWLPPVPPALSLIPSDQYGNYFYILRSFQGFEVSKVKIFSSVLTKKVLSIKKKDDLVREFFIILVTFRFISFLAAQGFAAGCGLLTVVAPVAKHWL